MKKVFINWCWLKIKSKNKMYQKYLAVCLMNYILYRTDSVNYFTFSNCSNNVKT